MKQMMQHIKKDVVGFGLKLFVFSLPFKLIYGPIAFAVLIICCFINYKNLNYKIFDDNKLPFLLILFYLINLISLFVLGEANFSYNKIDTLLLLFLIPFIFSFLNLDRSRILNIKKVFIFSMVLFCLIALLFLVYNLIVNFEHKRDYNFIQTSMYHFHYPYDVLYINAAYTLLLFNTKIESKLFKKSLITLLFFIVIVFSGVRLGMFCFVLISVVFIIKNFKKVFNYKMAIAIVASIIFGLILVKTSRYVNDKFFDSLSKLGFNTAQYVSDIGENYHKLTLRQKLWSTAITAYEDSPNKYFGYGPQGSRTVLDKIYNTENFTLLTNMNSHNQYLTTLLNNGIFGLGFLLIILFLALYKSIKSKMSENILIIFLITISFTTESMLERQKGVIFFALFITLIYSESNIISKNKSINKLI
jgi:O-antigen ligase